MKRANGKSANGKHANGKRLSIWVGILALVLALGAATSVTCSSDKGSASADGLVLNEGANGKSFTVQVGDTITVAIPGNPTTGYQWTADLSEASAALLTENGEPVYEQDSAGEGLVGSGGTYTFTFTAKATGEAELRLKYWRSFEPDVAPIDAFAATITIE